MGSRLHIWFLAALLSAAVSSCTKETMGPEDDPFGYPIAGAKGLVIASVHEDAEGEVYFLYQSSRYYPVNYTATRASFPYRAMGEVRGYGEGRVYVVWAEEIEQPEPGVACSKDDGLDIFSDWMTSVEDGFLTVHYETWWGDGSVKHRFGLVQGDTPYEVVLQHDTCGDRALEKADGLVCFDVNAFLPDTKGETVTLTLKWTTSAGKPAEREFGFRSRE